nr:MAG TPA: hypothetical protein [Caudoviricetes sp.]
MVSRFAFIICRHSTREARQTHNIKVKREARNHPIGFALRVYYM